MAHLVKYQLAIVLGISVQLGDIQLKDVAIKSLVDENINGKACNLTNPEDKHTTLSPQIASHANPNEQAHHLIGSEQHQWLEIRFILLPLHICSRT